MDRISPSSVDSPPEKEGAGDTQWGRYLTAIEHQGIVLAHSFAGVPGTALDFGCGTGEWSELLSSLGWNMICVDANAKKLERCKRRVPQAECVLGARNLNEIPARTGKVGMLMCIEVPSVIDAEWFTKECHRVLQPNGVFVGIFFNTISLRGMVKALEGYIKGQQHDYHDSYLAWKKKMTRAGFSMLYTTGFCWFPARRGSNSPLVSLFVRIEQLFGLRRLVVFSPWICFIARKDR